MIADIIVAVFMIVGSLMALTAAIGVLRFPDTLTRMHAATKPQTFGLLIILIGALIKLGSSVDSGMLVLSGLFMIITAPVVAHRIGRLAYQEQRMRDNLIETDEMETGRSD
ncbi:monovalent cation/H(+) antiporter subunit G [Gordonia jinhuaensis]|uniref:Na+/H+ antiporter subunit G n=1 Tax=Gordonia jinhuaensis TaxID=1517702 RepID=A0A916SWT4_9ACTN|nr:monovalent cation/H(+) antiporter subunit G [Gordonia jinhuaensis]GGB20284.1 Na+/H+ antiporter subunit G [Gordonia jinhuaensis]